MNENNNQTPTETVDYSFITNQPAAPTKKKPSKKIGLLLVLTLFVVLLVGVLSLVQSKRSTTKSNAVAEQVVRQLFVDMGNGDNIAALNAFTGPNKPDAAYLEGYLIAPLKSDYQVDSCTFASVETKAANYFQVQASCPQRQASNIRIRVDFTVMRQDQASKIVAYSLGGVDT
ncbi:MAG TPA: hypothetical protein PKA02_00060 [Candidatus Saccharibacteria bacterium]|nr:hypothetical protein [Candidatus Saccharibacteria bacterium]